MDDLVSDFIAETREGLEALDSELVRFEQHPEDPDTLGGIFRLIHTIKGTCGFLGLGRLQTIAHHAENVLGCFRDGTLPVTPSAVSAVLETVDLVRVLLDGLAATGTEPVGDDSALIARLEAVLEAGAHPSEAAAAPAEGALIDRVGGEATLDAAVEMALPRLKQQPALREADPDAIQAELRDALAAAARKSAHAARFVQALDARGVAAAARQEVFEAIAAALGDLDVGSAAVEALRALVLPRAEPQAPAAPPAATEAAPAAAGADAANQTIRVGVEALEHLMTVVSELVLIRNQLLQALRLEPESAFAAPLHRLNQVTSELQEGVMTTRMQPISGAWAKLPRLVRDLAHELGKKIELRMTGQETELDRQVLELIKDPLTHMIRNAADHGLETPEQRLAAGKPETGRISLQARHEGGAIVIEVADDGRGLSAERIKAKAVAVGLISAAQADSMADSDARQLIFSAGFSTAETVTSISGRGVGMDVVRTNIEKIGGSIEVSSAEGSGSRFLIRIPLTLTIVSALIVECCGERFALPQSSLVELVSASGASGHAIEELNGAAVLRLRDRLLPLVSLQQLLQLEPAAEPSGETCIVVARVGAFAFGLIVDRVFDTEEIVVKPVATVLRHLKLYSGATILGDGSVILILDPKGISVEAGAGQPARPAAEREAEVAEAEVEPRQSLLVFRAANQALKAAPLSMVARIEEAAAEQVEQVDGRAVIQYRGRLMPILGVDARPPGAWRGPRRPLLVFARGDRSVGLLVDEIVDIVDSAFRPDLPSGASEGALGSLIIGGAATELIDVDYYWRSAVGEPAPAATASTPAAPPALAGASRRLLVIDPSAFSQVLLQPLLAGAGYEVAVASTPEAAMERYGAGERFNLILADVGHGGAKMEAFARAMASAVEWHATPLVRLSVSTGAGPAGFDGSTLLEAISEALDEPRSAA